MPRDIRSYFASATTAKTNKNETSSRTNKRRIVSSDEEEEKTRSPVRQPKKTKRLEKHSVSSESNDEEKAKKLMSPADMFGKKRIKREEAPKVNKTDKTEEAKIHNDNDFEATLRQLDTSNIEKKYLEDAKPDKGTISERKKNDQLKDETEKEKQKKSPVKNKTKAQKDKKASQYEIIVEKKIKTEDNDTLDTSASEPYETPKAKQLALYKQYLARGGARDPGSKQIPEGAEYCLAGLSFLITGVLTSLEREQADELIQKYGGRILQQVSRKTDYLIVGDEPGPAKLRKAKELNVKQISEDDLLELIRTRPAGKPENVKPSGRGKGKQKSVESDETFMSSPPKKEKTSSPVEKAASSPVKKVSPVKVASPEIKKETTVNEPVKIAKKSPAAKVKLEIDEVKAEPKVAEVKAKPEPLREMQGEGDVEPLVEKYRPKTMKQILGQQGEKSNAKKLYKWLMDWHKNRSGNVKHTKPSPFVNNDTGAYYKAALLSGPPGIGKTTTVQVVCKELGFDLVEFNASDTRSKRLLKEEVSEMLNNKSLKGYFTDNKTQPTFKHVLLMDEVDGMAGNEDRGGLQELISLIKSTDIPIVCACNDASNPKMRTLSGYAYPLRFLKPKVEQIRAAMKSICFKEKIDISTEDLDRLIESTNQDIRQVINHLALFVGGTGHQEKTGRKHVNKDFKLGPWDVVRKVFSADEQRYMSIHDKSDLFFHDYSMAPLFVHENYLLVAPQAPRNELLERVAQCAESIALGDIVEKSIRSNNAWSLLPTQACFSSVIPGAVMSGHVAGQIMFPTWFGRNSKANKLNRLSQEITVHARLTTGVSKEAINLDYIIPLRNAIIRPLAANGTEGIEAAVDVMNQYHLLREDLDSLGELSLRFGGRDPLQQIDSKLRAAFTRAYNKGVVAMPYSVTGTTSKKRTPAAQDVGSLEDEEAEEVNSEEDEDNVESDKMIKAKKPSASKKAESKASSKDPEAKKTQKATKPAGRGRGRGRAK